MTSTDTVTPSKTATTKTLPQGTAQQDGQQQQPSPFPENLPPRKYTQTWMQRNKFQAKTFFTLHWRSYSLRRRRGPRDVCRRISMWLIMISRFGILVLIGFLFATGFSPSALGIFVVVLLMLIALAFLFVNAWCVAAIGDATGTRRALGLTVRRTGLDVFLHLMALGHLLFDGLFIFSYDAFLSLPVTWLAFGVVLLPVAIIAGMEPIDEYGIGV